MERLDGTGVCDSEERSLSVVDNQVLALGIGRRRRGLRAR